MGYRSTFISMDYPGELPQWFLDEYKNDIINPKGLLIMSNRQLKHIDDIFWDYQKALVEINFFDSPYKHCSIVVLGECGYITNVQILKDGVEFNWVKFDDDSFDYSKSYN
jgi:hypothetical protein